MISVEDVRRLAEADEPGATLMLVGGKAVISGTGESGGLPVITRADLLARLGSGSRLEAVAGELDVLARELGG